MLEAWPTLLSCILLASKLEFGAFAPSPVDEPLPSADNRAAGRLPDVLMAFRRKNHNPDILSSS